MKEAVRHSLSCPKDVSERAWSTFNLALDFLAIVAAWAEKVNVGSNVTPSNFRFFSWGTT